MMKRMITVWLLASTAGSLKAQTPDEWFKQKETQIKYLLEQIVALKSYGDMVNKGYNIAQNGLATIFNCKNKDYRQHVTYFTSLMKVKPGVKNYGKVASIFQMKAYISNQSQAAKRTVTELLNSREKEYITEVFKNLRVESDNLIYELNFIISDDQLHLKDDERIKRIDIIHSEMQDCYQFMRLFVRQVKALAVNRMKAKNEIDKLYSYYELK